MLRTLVPRSRCQRPTTYALHPVANSARLAKPSSAGGFRTVCQQHGVRRRAAHLSRRPRGRYAGGRCRRRFVQRKQWRGRSRVLRMPFDFQKPLPDCSCAKHPQEDRLGTRKEEEGVQQTRQEGHQEEPLRSLVPPVLQLMAVALQARVQEPGGPPRKAQEQDIPRQMEWPSREIRQAERRRGCTCSRGEDKDHQEGPRDLQADQPQDAAHRVA